MKFNKDFLIYPFVLFCLILIFPRDPFINWGCGLDYSWMIALNLAIKNGFIFGKDIIFTFGPLGFIATRCPIEMKITDFIFFDLMLLSLIFIVFVKILKSEHNIINYIFIFLMSTFVYYAGDMMTIFYFLVLSFYALYIVESKLIYILPAVILSLLGTFIKLNFGLIFFVMFFFFLGFLVLIEAKSLKKVCLLLVSYISGITALCWLLNVQLYDYVFNSLYIIDAYNDAMGFDLSNNMVNMIYILFSVIIIIIYLEVSFFGGYIIFRDFKRSKKYLFHLLFISLGLFVSYKQSVVRNHLEEFAKMILLCFGVMLLFGFKNNLKKVLYGNLIFAFSFVLCYYLYLSKEITGSNYGLNFDLFSKKTAFIDHYFKSFKKNRTLNYTTSCVFPTAEILNDLQTNNSDILPLEISFYTQNKVKYNPRPVFQTYAVYHSELDKLNANKYLSKTAPERLLFEIFSIDGRYQLHEETYTKLAIMSNYDYTGANFPDVYGSYFYFKKKDFPVKYTLKKIGDLKIKLDSTIILPKSDKILILKTNFKYSLMGKLRRTLFSPSQLKLDLINEKGESRTYRSIVPINNGGIIINKFLDFYQNGAEVETFFKYKGIKSRSLISFKFYVPESFGLEKESIAELFEVNFDEPKSINDTKEYYDIFNIKDVVNNKLQGQIEVLDTFNQGYLLKGWAGILSENKGCCNEIGLVLKRENQYLKVKGLINSRYMSLQQMNLSFNYANTGFSIFVDKEKLDLSKYESYLYAQDYSGNTAIEFLGLKFRGTNKKD